MSDLKIKYPAESVAIDIDLGALATSASLLAGAESAAITNRTNRDFDHKISGKIRAGTSPTVDKQIQIWVVPAHKVVSSTATYPDVFDGTKSAETWTSAYVRNSAARLLHTIYVDNTTGRDYYFTDLSVREACEGEMPTDYVVWVTHDTAVNLDADNGDHELWYQRVQYESV